MKYKVYCQTPSVDLRIGTTLPLSTDDKSIKPYLEDIWDGINMAVKDLEDEAAESGVRFTIINIDYHNTSFLEARPHLSVDGNALLLNATLELIQLPVVGLIGPIARHFHRSIADIAHIFKVPICNHASPLPIYSDRKLYPYMFSTVPSLSKYGITFLTILKKFNWSRFLILFSQEAFGTALANFLKTKTLDQPKLDIKLIPFWENGRLSQLNTSIDLALQTDYRIFLISAMGEARTTMLKTLFYRQVFSQYNITWFFLDDISFALKAVYSPQEVDYYYSEKSPLRGVFIIDIYNDLTRESSYELFQTKLSNYSTKANPGLAIDTYLCTAALMKGLLKHRNNHRSRPWDVHRFLDMGSIPLFGHLDFNSEASLPSGVEIFNWQSRGPKLIASVDASGKLSKVGRTMFLRGASSPPSDYPDKKNIYLKFESIPSIIVSSISGVLALLFVLAGFIFLAYYRHDELQPYTPLYLFWMSVGSLFYLGCIVMQFFLSTSYGCNVALLLGLLGAGNAIGPLIAKAYFIVNVLQHPFYQTITRPSSSSSSSLSLHPKAHRLHPTSLYQPLNRSSCLPSKSTQLSWFIVFVELILGTMYVFITPMEGKLVTIGSSSETYLCAPSMSSSESINQTTSKLLSFISENPIFYILALFHSCLMVWMMWMSWESQQADVKSTQSIRLVSIMAYQYSLVGVLIFLTWALDQYLYPISFWVRIAALFLTVMLYFFLFILPPLLVLYKRLRFSGQLSMMSLPSSNLNLPMTSEPILSTTTSNEYEGVLIYTEKKNSSLSLKSCFKWTKTDIWKVSSIKVVPPFNFCMILESNICFKYHKVIYKPNPGELGVSRILPHSLSTSVPHPSKHVFFVLTSDNVYGFWSQREEEAKKWVRIFEKSIM